MRVFVTGATGVLGRRLVERLAERGHGVVGLARNETGADLVETRGGTPRRGDVLERDSLDGPTDDGERTGAPTDAGTTRLDHVVDDRPVTAATFVTALADRLDAPRPRRVPGWLARFFVGKETVDMLTSPFPTTNDRFGEDVGWEPRYPTYREGLDQVVATWEDDGTLRETPDGYERVPSE